MIWNIIPKWGANYPVIATRPWKVKPVIFLLTQLQFYLPAGTRVFIWGQVSSLKHLVPNDLPRASPRNASVGLTVTSLVSGKEVQVDGRVPRPRRQVPDKGSSRGSSLETEQVLASYVVRVGRQPQDLVLARPPDDSRSNVRRQLQHRLRDEGRL